VRTAIILGVCLLAVVAALRLTERFLPASELGRHPNDAGVPVIAAARGELLSFPRYPPTGDELNRVVLLGDATYSIARHGLLLVLREPESGERLCVDLDPGALDVDLARFERLVSDAETGTQLVIISSGRVKPSGPGGAGRLKRLEGVLAELAARSRPFEPERVSWAYIGVRLRSGWARLCEGFSDETGVLLSFILSPDWRDYRGFAGEVAVFEADDGAPAFRLARLLQDGTRSSTVRIVPSVTLGGVELPSIFARPTVQGPQRTPTPSSVVWERVPLSRGSRFETHISLQQGRQASDGVRFQLLIDGRLVHEEAIGAGQAIPAGWRSWDLDLSAFAGQAVRFELRVDPGGNSAGDWALWGDPVIFR